MPRGRSRSNKSNNSVSGQLIIGIVIAVAAGIILFLITTEYNNYAIVEQGQLSAAQTVNPGNALAVSLYISNGGNAAITPTCTITVINATIIGVSIPEAAPQQQSEFYNYNNDTATITNLTLASEQGSTLWATISLTPNPNVSSFEVYSSATCPSGIFSRNQVVNELPDVLFYNLTNSYSPYYELVKG